MVPKTAADTHADADAAEVGKRKVPPFIQASVNSLHCTVKSSQLMS